MTHLALNHVTAQKHGQLLATLQVPARDPGYLSADGGAIVPVKLSTNVVFPLGAPVLLFNGQALAVDAGTTEAAVAVGDTLTVGVANGVVTVSVVAATGVECPSDGGATDVTARPSATFSVLDASSGPPVGRWAIVHAATLPSDLAASWKDCFARVAFLIGGASCTGQGGCAAEVTAAERAAAMSATNTWNASGGEWTVEVTFPQGEPQSLRVARSVPGGAIVAQQVDGTPMVFAPLTLNGVALTLALPDGGP